MPSQGLAEGLGWCSDRSFVWQSLEDHLEKLLLLLAREEAESGGAVVTGRSRRRLLTVTPVILTLHNRNQKTFEVRATFQPHSGL